MQTMTQSLLILAVLAFVLFIPIPHSASAATNARLMAESEEMGRWLMRTSLISWQQSQLQSYCPRLSTIGGPVERVAEAARYITPDVLESALATNGEVTGETLGYMLTASCRPALLEKNPYIDITKEMWPNGKSFEAALYEEIMKQPGQLMPGQALYIAIYMCDDDYWLATLTLHNLLKEAAYASRDSEPCVLAYVPGSQHDPSSPSYRISPQDLLSKLVNLREPNDPHVKDLIGPWYHMFGILFYSGVTTCGESLLLAHTENITRWLGLGSSRDAFKEDVNVWAAHTSEMLNDIVAENPHLTYKYLDTWPQDELDKQLTWINSKHGELQTRLAADRELVVGNDNKAALAEEHMDYLRAYQRALVSEAERIRGAPSLRSTGNTWLVMFANLWG